MGILILTIIMLLGKKNCKKLSAIYQPWLSEETSEFKVSLMIQTRFDLSKMSGIIWITN